MVSAFCGITPRNRYFLAPMAGITDSAFRTVCTEFGAAVTYTEMVSAKALVYQDKKTCTLLQTEDDHRPCIAQIFGSEPEVMAQAAQKVVDICHPLAIDINMGCPVPKIVSNGEGSALMKNPELAEEIIREVAKAAHVPVTVKMRLGFEPGSEAYLELGERAQRAGAAMITLHARTRSQYYEGHADWSAIKRLKERVSIPVVGNGDITCWQDAMRMIEETGCDGVAVGRAAQGNPWIFEQIKDGMAGKPVRVIPASEKLSVLLRHAHMLAALKGESVAVREMRRHVVCYVRGMRDAAKLRMQVNSILTMEALEEALTAFMLSRE